MSDFPPPGGPPPPGMGTGPAPGWWQASDGNWYPPDQQPGYGMPPAGYGYGYPVQATPGTNGMAIASLVCSLLSFFTCISGILGIIFGHVALSQIKRTGENGRGLAVAGLVIGYLFVVVIIVLVVFAFALGDSSSNEFDFGNDLGLLLR